MAKKSSLNVLYLVGMALVALGFVLPIFQFSSILGKHQFTGFDLVGDGDTALKIYTLLIFIGGIAGVVLSFVKVQNAKLLKLAAFVSESATVSDFSDNNFVLTGSSADLEILSWSPQIVPFCTF